jgi:YegS/Rv2252/BmrU family lipid kinase
MRKVTIICRAGSRTGLNAYRRAVEELPKLGVRITAAHVVRRRKDLRKAVRQAVKSGAGIVVVIGGDGSQTAAVAELANSDCTLAVVPSGTGNSFALGLGITADIEQAIHTIATGKEMRVDVGCVNGDYFANFATVGILAEAADETPKPLKRIIGPLAYVVGFIRPLFRRKPFSLHVKWPGHDLSIETQQAVVAAGRFYGWKPLIPGANVRSGELAFFSATATSVADVMKINAALALGDQTKVGDAHYFSAPEIKVTTKPKQLVSIDGHTWGKTPVKFKVAKKALRVLVPADFEAKE